MCALNTYVRLSSRLPGASGQETWLAQYGFRYFCVPSHLKTVKLTEVPVVCIEVLSTVVR